MSSEEGKPATGAAGGELLSAGDGAPQCKSRRMVNGRLVVRRGKRLPYMPVELRMRILRAMNDMRKAEICKSRVNFAFSTMPFEDGLDLPMVREVLDDEEQGRVTEFGNLELNRVMGIGLFRDEDENGE